MKTTMKDVYILEWRRDRDSSYIRLPIAKEYIYNSRYRYKLGDIFQNLIGELKADEILRVRLVR